MQPFDIMFPLLVLERLVVLGRIRGCDGARYFLGMCIVGGCLSGMIPTSGHAITLLPNMDYSRHAVAG